MQLSHKKREPEQRRERRQVQRSGGASPAFSYYNNQLPDVPRQRNSPNQPTPQKSKRLLSPLGTQLPFWLLLGVAIICALKVLELSTSPKIIVVANNSLTATYVQSTNAYASAAKKQLVSSIANRSKLTVDVSGIAASLKRQFPELQTVSVGIPLVNNRPIIYIGVAKPSVIVETTQGNFALNSIGLVLAQVHSVAANIPTIVDQSSDIPKPGTQFLPGSTIEFIQIVAYQFSKAKLAVSTYVLPTEAPYELDMRLEGKAYLIRFNLEADALTQSGAALATIQQLAATEPGDYLDVRTPGQVYYK